LLGNEEAGIAEDDWLRARADCARRRRHEARTSQRCTTTDPDYRITIDKWSGKQKVAPADHPGAFVRPAAAAASPRVA
jgi:hypothetical protein